MTDVIAALDQGTTSTRCLLFDRDAQIVGSHQLAHRQIYPQPGWVEHDPVEIWQNSRTVLATALQQAGRTTRDLAGIGIANQRETVVVWEKPTGRPVYPAIVWQDTRTAVLCECLSIQFGVEPCRVKTGLPPATYFAGPKIQWILDRVDPERVRARRGELLGGTIDTWLLWNLTGGVHVTDPTNASRTLLMDLATLDWDADLLAAMNIPRALLPVIHSSSEIFAHATGAFAGVPVAALLGDQQAALFGHAGFEIGAAKNTYGTGCFLLQNTGSMQKISRHGLLTTVAYRLGSAPPVYALEGSVAIAGALIHWLRDNLGLIQSSAEVETLAQSVADSGGVVIVPAFAGLFAPYWRVDAAGAILGLRGHTHKGHIARAALEAVAFQTRELLDALKADTGHAMSALKVDGGMVVNETLLQIQADLLGIPVIRPALTEITALGAAFAAGLAVGFWPDCGALTALSRSDRQWVPCLNPDEREQRLARWKQAVTRTFGWRDAPPEVQA